MEQELIYQRSINEETMTESGFLKVRRALYYINGLI